MPVADREPILQVKDLATHFPVTAGGIGRHRKFLKAVDGVSFEIKRGETLGLVGESGCGKSTIGRTILRLEQPTRGSIQYKGREVANLDRDELKEFRREVQIVFQDPYSSLNPRMTIGRIVKEPWIIHDFPMSRTERDEAAVTLLERVGLSSSDIRRFPHEFSGGQRQRIGIARALALEPDLIVCDEPVSALDVSVQAQVINLLGDLQKELGIAYLFISHDLSVVRHLSHRIGVMYLGKLVEVAETETLFGDPTHPYTQALLSAVPIPDVDVDRTRRIVLSGEIPSAIDPPSGCAFRTRCWRADELCVVERPDLRDEGGLGHSFACHYPAGHDHTGNRSD